MTDAWGFNTVLTRSSRGGLRCEHGSNTEVAEKHIHPGSEVPYRHRLPSGDAPRLSGYISPCYCRVTPRWGRLHNMLRRVELREYYNAFTVDPPLLGHGSWRFSNRHEPPSESPMCKRGLSPVGSDGGSAFRHAPRGTC